MRISWLWDNAVTLATLVMAVTAIVALFYAHLQIAEGRKAQQQTNANELWRETLRLGFENPKLSDPSLKLADFDYEKLTIDRRRELFQQYEIYVDTLLNLSRCAFPFGSLGRSYKARGVQSTSWESRHGSRTGRLLCPCLDGQSPLQCCAVAATGCVVRLPPAGSASGATSASLSTPITRFGGNHAWDFRGSQGHA
jgi:hypothetical protein